MVVMDHPIMIKECIWFGRDKINTEIKNHEPPAIIPEHYAAINIYDPGSNPTHYPHWVRPILFLSFHDICPRVTGDRVLDQKTARALTAGSYVLVDDVIAQKIIKFIDSLHKQDREWILLVNGESGVSRSAAVARFVHGIAQIPIKGLSYPTTENHNGLLTSLLNKNYSLLFAEA